MNVFKRLDPRLMAELKAQRKTIALGLACVLITSLLTSATIWFIERSVRAISDAAPIRSASAPSLAPQMPDAELKRVAAELNMSETEAREFLRSTDEALAAERRDALVRQAQARNLDPEAVEKAFGFAAETQEEAEQRRRNALVTLGWTALAIVGIFAIKYIFTRGQSYFLSKAAAELAADLRRRMFAKLQRLPINYFHGKRSGAIQSVLTNDVNVYQNAVMIIRDSIDGPIKAVTALVTIFILQWQLAAMALLTFPVMWLFIQRNGKRMRVAQRKVQDDLANLNSVTAENLQGVRIVKAFSAEARMEASYGEHVQKALKSQLVAARRVASLRPLVELIGAVALALVLYFCGFLAFRGQLQLSQIAALIFAFDVINQGFRSLGYVNNTYNQVQAAAGRIYDLILDVEEEHASLAGAKRLENPTGRIEFHDVWFTYADGTEALRGVSFVLEPGTSLALVGPSGAGKSTIADLLLRFYDPTKGHITFDGVDLRDLDKQWLRERIGVVPQQNFLFAGTIADNLRLGAPSATDDDLREAARIAHADVFIDPQPEGYNAIVGERGVGLSGGEIQRVAIARALVRKPTLLLLDEATSALDAHSEKAVQEALDELMATRTSLFIAHRLTTAARATRILVLRRGEVVESGSHRDLMDRQGVYASMYQAFSSGILGGDQLD